MGEPKCVAPTADGETEDVRTRGKWTGDWGGADTAVFDGGDEKLLDEMFRVSGLSHLRAASTKLTMVKRIKVLDTDDYHRAYKNQSVAGDGDPNESGGFTDKAKGMAYLHRRKQTGRATVQSAVHEGIHLLAAPFTA